MDFSQALNLICQGKRVTRTGWNGKGQFINLGTNVSFIDVPTNTVINANHKSMGNSVLVFNSTAGIQVGWLASQEDMLATDWELIEDK